MLGGTDGIGISLCVSSLFSIRISYNDMKMYRHLLCRNIDGTLFRWFRGEALIGSMLLVVLLIGSSVSAQGIPKLPTLREQASIRQGWLRERLDTVLPQLMRDNNIDMWVVQMSEYNEDPVFRALVSPTRFAARRRSIFVFYDNGFKFARPLGLRSS